MFSEMGFCCFGFFFLGKVYPKVKVRVQREEADQYDYEKSSLESLKAFEWLSLHHLSSSDESTRPVVRVPRSYAPKSPTPSFLRSKEETNETKAIEENQKNVRATSAPRPRAVLSSPDNDEIIGSKAQARRGVLSGLKNRNPYQNRHTQCKIFPKSTSADSFGPTQGNSKESTEPKNDIRAKSRTAVADSITRTGHRKKMTSSAVQS